MITAKEMRRVAMESASNTVARAEAYILAAAADGARRCLLHYEDADVAHDIEEILVDQGFRVSVEDKNVSSMLVTW